MKGLVCKNERDRVYNSTSPGPYIFLKDQDMLESKVKIRTENKPHRRKDKIMHPSLFFTLHTVNSQT